MYQENQRESVDEGDRRIHYDEEPKKVVREMLSTGSTKIRHNFRIFMYLWVTLFRKETMIVDQCDSKCPSNEPFAMEKVAHRLFDGDSSATHVINCGSKLLKLSTILTFMM